MAGQSARRSRRRQKISLVKNIIFSLITLSALTGRIILLLKNYSLENSSKEVMSRLEEYEKSDNARIYTEADLETYSAQASEEALEQGKREVLVGEDIVEDMLLVAEVAITVVVMVFIPVEVFLAEVAVRHLFPVITAVMQLAVLLLQAILSTPDNPFTIPVCILPIR